MVTGRQVLRLLGPVLMGIVPVVMGVVLMIWGLIEKQWGTVALGAGLLGLPGIRESLKVVGDEKVGSGDPAGA